MTVERSSPIEMSQTWTGGQIRNAFLAFFAERQHQILPSASLVPEDPTVLLTIAGMLPFKPVFLGQKERPAARATTSQKCIRTNDIENVGRTARHHTFFEMLGNFSFGDYFKKEAIQWSWELSTQVFGLDPKNLVVSVFREDDEAEVIWREVVGVNPNRIIRMDEADNFWASGPTGPCGPCSEIYYDFKPELGDIGINLDDDTRFIEFYNLVFMQYNRDALGKLTLLEKCNIDTGLGLERMAQILQGVPNNYETDLIYPLIQKAALLADIDYKKVDIQRKTSLKVIGDHSRAVTHLICDGVTASNLGRGYILRRLVRRVIRHGRLIGIAKPFLVEMGETAINLMESVYPQLLERRDVILQELQREEARFLETLERGEKLLVDLLSEKPSRISGEKAFELYDTYGFPLELTQEIAEENNLSVDVEGFDRAMAEQRQRAKAASISIDLTVQDAVDQMAIDLESTNFLGYELLESRCTVQRLLVNGKPAKIASIDDSVQIALDTTTFYGEGGGQVGDCGTLVGVDFGNNSALVEIETVTRNDNVFVHAGRITRGTLKEGDTVDCRVDHIARRRVQSNHTATHMLQSALKQVIDPGISQAGSLVNFDRLRFDFHAPREINPAELEQLEKLVNSWIAEAHPLVIQEMEIEEAMASGAVAMFGEKYGDLVRVVDIPDVSMELCGGTHVKNTSELGIFKIVSECGIASGIRRIEALAGQGVLDYLQERDGIVKELGERFKVKPNQIVGRVASLQNEVKSTMKALAVAHEELALVKVLSLSNESITIKDSQYLVKRLDGIDGNALQNAAQSLVDKLGKNAAVILAGQPDLSDQKKVIFVANFGSQIVTGGLHAGQFVGSIAKLCGGGGGGRSTCAQAGGRDVTALNSALDFAREEFISALS
ncbi:alanine--tRNA ligase [Prochlorococcus sp. MIT 1307]|uniref:alanine--tRNA ligase n=1 Tax=Prochlorococcus sp. MIT 1307 TaxID=3096219 RepID=UPI002A7558F6|nr:alanine--tRNA ligase [Prochlorococcus sp. MIT 1307]